MNRDINEISKTVRRWIFYTFWILSVLLVVASTRCYQIKAERNTAETALHDCHAERLELYRTLADIAPDPYKELVDSLTSEE